jgi:hypothetical protein
LSSFLWGGSFDPAWGTGPNGEMLYGCPLVTGAMSTEHRYWWLGGICVNSNQFTLLLVTKPCPGWAAYSSEILNRMRLSPFTCFFTHPNGTWAFFNQERIYNKGGVPDWDRDIIMDRLYRGERYYDYGAYMMSFDLAAEQHFHRVTMQMAHFTSMRANDGPYAYTGGATPDPVHHFEEWMWTMRRLPVTAGQFQHCIFDRVHFEYYDPKPEGETFVKRTGDTTFRELYNAAVAGFTGDTAAGGEIKQITLADMTATFETNTITTTGGKLYLKLIMHLCGKTYYIPDQSLSDDDASVVDYNAESTYKPLTSGFWYLESGYQNVLLEELITRFSSPTALDF